jgi:NAD-dependent SIR2 family protein deacetylase
MPDCGGLLRPHVVWFGESLYPDIMSQASEELENCDLCLVVCFELFGNFMCYCGAIY